MSNRDRIARMQEEAEARTKESAKERAKERADGRAPAKAAAPGRMKIVWAVCAVNGTVVKTFPYPEKARAEAEVARLSAEAPHHLRAEKVPLES
jgi:hypothetical protein